MGQRFWPHSPDLRHSPGRCWQPSCDQACEVTLKKLSEERAVFVLLGPFLSHVYCCCPATSVHTDSLCVYSSLGWFHVDCNNCTVNSWQSWHQLFDLNLRLFLPYHVAFLFRIQKHTPFKMSSLYLLSSFIVAFLEMPSHHTELIHESLCIHVWAWHSLYTWNNRTEQRKANSKTFC